MIDRILLLITGIIGAGLAWAFFHYGGQYALLALIGYGFLVIPLINIIRKHG